MVRAAAAQRWQTGHSIQHTGRGGEVGKGRGSLRRFFSGGRLTGWWSCQRKRECGRCAWVVAGFEA